MIIELVVYKNGKALVSETHVQTFRHIALGAKLVKVNVDWENVPMVKPIFGEGIVLKCETCERK